MNRRDFIATVGASSAALLAGPARAAGEPRLVQTDGHLFRDSLGRELILRGVNCGGRSKMPPFYPFEAVPDFETGLTRYADAVAGFGFNVVRLLVIYEAAEPTRGSYDEDYLKKYDAMVSAFARRGIYIVIDAHQDVFSRRFHGDGFPDWALRERDRDNPISHSRRVWNRGYLSSGALTGFQKLYSDTDGLQKSYCEFFAMLARRYAAEPMVIGFEPINEPMPGTWGYINYEGFQRDLSRMYERVADAVQAVDPRFLIFTDICSLENTGTINPYRPRPDIKNLALAPHYYDLGTFGLIPGGNRRMMLAGLGSHLKLARRWDVPVLVTEYGVSPEIESAPEYIEKLYSIFDATKISGTFWEASMSDTIWNHEQTSILSTAGEPRPRSLALDRPYPRAVAGGIESFSFDPVKKMFELRWRERVAAPTEVYVPARVFGSSPCVEISGESAGCQSLVKDQVLRIEPTGKSGDRRLVVR